MKEESMTNFTISSKIISLDVPTDESLLIDVSCVKWVIFYTTMS